MPENVYLAMPIFCHTAVLYYAKLPLFYGRKFLLYHCYSSLKFLSELFFLHEIIPIYMKGSCMPEHTVSTNSVTVIFKAKPIAAANIIKTACT